MKFGDDIYTIGEDGAEYLQKKFMDWSKSDPNIQTLACILGGLLYQDRDL